MASGLEIINPTELYNLLNQGGKYPELSDPNYLLLIDAREKHEYNESHIITAKKAPLNEKDDFVVPYDAELECKYSVVVYDGNTGSLKETGPAITCATVYWNMGCRNPVKILKGGYEAFSALYPFLRTQKIIYMPRELDEMKTYPIEILPGALYMGNWEHGNAAYIQKDLKIKAHVNCSMNAETFFKEEGKNLMHIQVADTEESDLHSKFHSACDFIDERYNEKNTVLVFSDLGISRSATIVIAFLMHNRKCTLEKAYAHVKKCCTSARPIRAFVRQLAKFESDLQGESLTDISDPHY